MTKEACKEKLAGRGFTVKEEIIYKLSLIYNQMCLKYMGIAAKALSHMPEKAKSHRNWGQLAKLSSFLLAQSYDPTTYLEVIFKDYKYTSIAKRFKIPPCNMLYGKWAKETWEINAKSKERKYLPAITQDEYKFYEEVLADNAKKLKLMQAIEPGVVGILSMVHELDPVYLAFNPEFLELSLTNKLTLPPDVPFVLKRMRRDKVFFNKITAILDRVQCE